MSRQDGTSTKMQDSKAMKQDTAKAATVARAQAQAKKPVAEVCTDMPEKTAAQAIAEEEAAKASRAAAAADAKKKKEEEAQEREVMKAVKGVVFKLEKINYSHLYVYKARGGWYMMGGHSVLFFKHLIAPKLHKKVTIRADKDFYYSFHDGVVSFKSYEPLKEALARVGIFEKGKEKGHVVFDLLAPVDKAQLEEMRNIEKKALEEINKIIDPENILRETIVKVREVQSKVLESCRKLDAPSRDVLGADTVRLATNMMDQAIRTCRGQMSKTELLDVIQAGVVSLEARVTLLIDERRMDLAYGVKLMKSLVYLEDKAKKECTVNAGGKSGYSTLEDVNKATR